MYATSYGQEATELTFNYSKPTCWWLMLDVPHGAVAWLLIFVLACFARAALTTGWSIAGGSLESIAAECTLCAFVNGI
jgi:hypothetical protein